MSENDVECCQAAMGAGPASQESVDPSVWMYRHAYLGLFAFPEQLLSEQKFKMLSLPGSFGYFEV